jgi:hypothetical protein
MHERIAALGLCLTCLALAGCGGKSNCPGNSSDPCQRLVNAFDCESATLTNCSTTPTTLTVSTCDQEVLSCTPSDKSELDQLAMCLSDIPGGDCDTDPGLIEALTTAEESCISAMSLSAACQNATGFVVTAWGDETEDGLCPNPPTELTGSLAPGAACTEGTQCAPACCTCTSGNTQAQFLGAACQNEVCVAEASICTVVNGELPGSADDPCN